MDVKKYWLSSRSQRTQNIQLGRSYTKSHNRSSSPYTSSYDGTKTLWKMLWRKLKRSSDKKKVFNSPTTMEGVYDPETYSMNFDQGTGWMEPDNLPRSFSARFADPSKILPPKHLLG
ncbi:uncharacterized protein LOC113866197 [Abrus precatorius]|uniref:Uncharacterized protein LOC113866197 n=1 Tax=Abrus precatorius TaxID=3816 RepID=A0A8B8LKU1_ABRPR|nr:uncharacterized protein LOC113866197 [Abrus precatorius]